MRLNTAPLTNSIVLYDDSPLGRALLKQQCIHCGKVGYMTYYGYVRGYKDGSSRITVHCNACFTRGPIYKFTSKRTGKYGEYTKPAGFFGRPKKFNEEIIEFTFTPV